MRNKKRKKRNPEWVDFAQRAVEASNPSAEDRH